LVRATEANMDSRETSSPSLWGRLTRDRRFDKHTVARKLISHCLSLQSNSGCTLSPSFNSGSEHVVKLIEFEDGITWVARLPLPAYMDDESGRFASNWKTRVDSEVATHRFIR